MNIGSLPRSWRARALSFVAITGALAITAYGGARGIDALAGDDPPPQSGSADAGGEVPIDPADQAACKELIAGFVRYPLVWAGDELLGYELNSCQHAHGPFVDSVAIAYGTCVLPDRPEPSCSIPVQIQVSAPCGLQIYGGRVAEKTELRGAPATVLDDGTVRIEARGMTVDIAAPGSPKTRRSNADEVADLLVPANELAAALKPGDSLNIIDPVRVGPTADAPAGASTADTASCLAAINADYGTTPDQVACQETAAAYQNLPLVFAGDRVLDYRLEACGSGEDGDGRDVFTFLYVAYRECVGRQAGGICMSRLDLEVHPPCTPDAPKGEDAGVSEFRGAPARIRRDRVYLSAAAYKLQIQGSLQEEGKWPEIATAFTDALVPANDLASALKPGDPLSAVPAVANEACP